MVTCCPFLFEFMLLVRAEIQIFTRNNYRRVGESGHAEEADIKEPPRAPDGSGSTGEVNGFHKPVSDTESPAPCYANPGYSDDGMDVDGKTAPHGDTNANATIVSYAVAVNGASAAGRDLAPLLLILCLGVCVFRY